MSRLPTSCTLNGTLPSDFLRHGRLPGSAAHHDKRVLWVGLSGGVDSVVLLHWLHSQALPMPLRAIHINHQISSSAQNWQRFVEALCGQWSIPLAVRCVELNGQGVGLEAAARDARYQAFAEIIAPGDVLAVAHHQNDQAETLLLRLLRGAGLKGLAAMPAVRPLPVARASAVAAQLWRPLLECSRATIEAYAKEHDLQWVEDDSNQDLHIARNFLRHAVLPKLAVKWPNAAQNLARTAAHLKEADQLLAAYVADDLQALAPRPEKQGQSISLEPLLAWPQPRQKAVLRYWIEQAGYNLPEAAHLVALFDVIYAKPDAKPKLALADYVLARFRQRLYLLSKPATPKRLAHGFCATLLPGAMLRLPDGSLLSVAGVTESLVVRYRQPGDRAHPVGRSHSQTLKKLMQEYDMPPWLRDCTPLILWRDRLVAVGDYWIEKETPTELSVLCVSWRYSK